MRRSPVVVTGLFAWACAGAPADRVGAIREVDPAQARQPNTQLNAWSEHAGMLYRSSGGRCVVFPDDGVQRPPGAMPPAVEVPCPPSMTAPAWDDCQGGTLSTTATAGDCSCFVGGNPPPPPRTVRCPPT